MDIHDEEIKQLEEDYVARDKVPQSGEMTQEELIASKPFSGQNEDTEIEFPGQSLHGDSKFQLSPSGQKIMVVLVAVAVIAAVCFFFIPKQEKAANNLIATDKKEKTEEVVIEEENEPMETVAVIEEDELIANDERMVSLAVEESVGRSNPFLPGDDAVSDTMKYGFDLMAPPESISTDSPASRIVTTKVSGIMYDPYNPSAILNIEGDDYFVHAGDNINGFKILSITKDMVTVQLGQNVYKTRVGQAIAEGEINYNNVYNLQKKFGGARR